MRHAIDLESKVGRTNAETAWMNAVLGGQYSVMLERAVRYVAALPSVYNAADMSEASIPDSVLLTAVQGTPGLLQPLV